MTKRKRQYWVIPPEANGEFVANMENILDTYARPYDERFPVVCMDEQPIQLLKETRLPIAASAHHPQRVDYEYERAGTASLFMFAEALSGWRQVRIRAHRTKVDWALEVEDLLRSRYGQAEQVILVCDNLNTHTIGAFYEAFAPAEARALVRRLDIRYTPKHGSWLNIAENKLSALTRQCLKGRRLGDIERLREETAAWEAFTNDQQRGVAWQFKIADARTKLCSLYPKIITRWRAAIAGRSRIDPARSVHCPPYRPSRAPRRRKPLRSRPHPSCAAWPGGALPCHAWLRAVAAGSRAACWRSRQRHPRATAAGG